MLGRAVPVPVYRHHSDATSFHQAAARHLLKAMWLILQSDKGLSSVRLAEALGISQPTAWRLGHALRLMMSPNDRLGGTVEIDGFYFGGEPRKGADGPDPGRGRKGLRKTLKTPVLAVVQRPADDLPGSPPGVARASVVKNLSASESARVLERDLQRSAHLISDELKSFMALGHNFVAHDTVRHSKQEYVRGDVHANSAEGFNSRVRRTVAGVFHHISPEHADLYFCEIGFRWSQRIAGKKVDRRSRDGRIKSRRPLVPRRPGPPNAAPSARCSGPADKALISRRDHDQPLKAVFR